MLKINSYHITIEKYPKSLLKSVELAVDRKQFLTTRFGNLGFPELSDVQIPRTCIQNRLLYTLNGEKVG